jgi:hypothetical protein
MRVAIVGPRHGPLPPWALRLPVSPPGSRFFFKATLRILMTQVASAYLIGGGALVRHRREGARPTFRRAVVSTRASRYCNNTPIYRRRMPHSDELQCEGSALSLMDSPVWLRLGKPIGFRA